MGFRLQCYAESSLNGGHTPLHQYYGTKYFGYVDNDLAIKSNSYLYLKSINKLPKQDSDEYHFWEEPYTEDILLSHEQFVIFIESYAEDYKLLNNGYNLCEDDDIKLLLKSNESIYISWG